MDGDDGECIEIFEAPDEWSAMEQLMAVHALCINVLHLEGRTWAQGRQTTGECAINDSCSRNTNPCSDEGEDLILLYLLLGEVVVPAAEVSRQSPSVAYQAIVKHGCSLWWVRSRDPLSSMWNKAAREALICPCKSMKRGG